MELIKKYAIYVVLVLAVAFHIAVAVDPALADNTTIAQVDGVLVFLGLGSIRGALASIFAGVDLGPVGLWITGKKTYIIALVGVVGALASAFGLFAPDNAIWIAVKDVLEVLGVGTFASGMLTLRRESLAKPSVDLVFNK